MGGSGGRVGARTVFLCPCDDLGHHRGQRGCESVDTHEGEVARQKHVGDVLVVLEGQVQAAQGETAHERKSV